MVEERNFILDLLIGVFRILEDFVLIRVVLEKFLL